MIYVITTSLLNAFKIGFWSKTPKKLWSRYLTYYGPEMTISIFPCDDKKIEGKAHKDLKNHRIPDSRELYKISSFDFCHSYLQEIFGTPRLYDKNGLLQLNIIPTKSTLTYNFSAILEKLNMT